MEIFSHFKMLECLITLITLLLIIRYLAAANSVLEKANQYFTDKVNIFKRMEEACCCDRFRMHFIVNLNLLT